jgi:hypothetical protein
MVNLNQLEQYALSEDDIRELVGNSTKIVTYPDLKGKTLNELLTPEPYCVLLFLTENKHNGHWQCLLKQPNQKLEVFDSFGLYPDGNRVWLTDKKLNALDQALPSIHLLLQGYPGEVVYNNQKLQEESKNTCGRHIASRILHNHLSIQDYVDLIRNSEYPNADEFVTRFTYRLIHK